MTRPPSAAFNVTTRDARAGGVKHQVKPLCQRSPGVGQRSAPRAVTTFFTGFKGAPLARRAARPSLAQTPVRRHRRGGIARAWRRPTGSRERSWPGELHRSGAAALPAASALDGARRGRLPRVRSPASARSRATRRNAPFGGQAQHERSGVGKRRQSARSGGKYPGALPPDPRPSLKDEWLDGHPLARSGNALRRNLRGRKGSLRSAQPGRPLRPRRTRRSPRGARPRG
jgi:hypothetical protein